MTPFTDEEARAAYKRAAGDYYGNPAATEDDEEKRIGRALLSLEAERDEKAAWWAASADRAKALEARVRELELERDEWRAQAQKARGQREFELENERDAARREADALREALLGVRDTYNNWTGQSHPRGCKCCDLVFDSMREAMHKADMALRPTAPADGPE